MEAEPGPSVEGVSGLPILVGSAPPSSGWPPRARPRGPTARFFAAVFLSLYGDWLTTVALLVVLFELTHSPAAPAGYMLVRVAPRVLGPWLGGRLTDRMSPRSVMVVTSLLQAILTASLVVSHRAALIWALYIAVGLAQFTGALGRPSLGTALPQLVTDKDLPRANATYGLLFSTSIFVAPAVGAVLLIHVGPDPLFAIDAATFALAALLMATLPGGTPRATADTRQPEARRGAIRLALKQPDIRMVAVANFAGGLTATVTQALLVVAAHERFGGDAVVGYLYSGVGIGGAVGGLVALRWIPSRDWTRFAVFIAATVLLVATAAFSASSIVLLALLTLAASAVAGSSLDTWGMTEIQRRAPAGLMGRYNSIIFLSLYAGMLVGAVWALATAPLLHWDVAIQISCAAMLVLVGGVWIVRGGSASAIPAEQEEP
jgi:MFS family permease